MIPASNQLQIELGDREVRFEVDQKWKFCHNFKYLKLLVPIIYVTLIVNKLKGDSSHLFLIPIVERGESPSRAACFFLSMIRRVLSG